MLASSAAGNRCDNRSTSACTRGATPSAVVPGIILGAAAAVSESAISLLSVVILLALVFVFLPTLFASFYTGARDIFVEFAPTPPRSGRAD